ncbi:MAG TPA: DNA polymerase III subunit beta [Phototrophicaceae bacterium]|nr:DNA polymerase III subunit beta [Phototrophicaceae bacterium]
MRVSILQDQLARGLSIVSRAVDSRPTLPVLANVLLATEDARLKLAATNLEMSITTYIGAKVDRPGGITLPAKTFGELVSNLSPERVDLTLDEATQTVNVRCGMTNSNIKGISASEFPPVPETAEPDVVLPAKLIRDMINQTVFAAAKEDNRPILTGLYTHFEGNVMTIAAADGYRLAVRTAQIEENFAKPRTLVIPAKTMAELARIIGDEDKEVGITLPGDRDLALFYYESTIISTQLLEGKFPDFGALIPKSYSTSMTVYTTDLLRACKRAEIFARDSNYSARVFVKPAKGPSEPGEVTVIGKSAERGDNEGSLDASVEGDGLEVAFNIRYLIDVLNVINDERVVLESNGSAHPGVIRPENGKDFVCIIMPMSINR